MIEFKVEDMSCGHCASVITKTVKALDAQATVDIDLTNKTVKIDSNEERAALAQVLEDAGYPTA
jgi:copper chaperone